VGAGKKLAVRVTKKRGKTKKKDVITDRSKQNTYGTGYRGIFKGIDGAGAPANEDR